MLLVVVVLVNVDVLYLDELIEVVLDVTVRDEREQHTEVDEVEVMIYDEIDVGEWL